MMIEDISIEGLTMKKYYLHAALLLCGISLFMAGYLIADFYTTSEIKAVQDWTYGYRHGVMITRYDIWKKYGITEFDPAYEPEENEEVDLDITEGDIDHSEI